MIINGLRCRKRLWASVHRPVSRVDGTRKLRVSARTRVVGSALSRLGTDAEFGVAVEHEGMKIVADALVPTENGSKLINVCSAGSVKSHHIKALAVQWIVLTGSGRTLERAEVIHINTEHNGLLPEPLFLSVDVTNGVQRLVAEFKESVAELAQSIEGPEPAGEHGRHCFHPYTCPYANECHPRPSGHPLRELYRVKERVRRKIEAQKIEDIKDIPDSVHLPPIPARQREACKKGGLVLSPGLKEALNTISYPAVFIDFEAIQPAIAPWKGCRPFGLIPVQVSVHRVESDGTMSHNEWLSDDTADPRPALSRWVAKAIRGAATLVAYHASFEQNVIGRLASFAPAEEALVLRHSQERFVDLLPIIRNFVYHPDFRGRFNLKTVVSVLLPDLNYSNLKVQRGDVASWLLEEFIVHEEPKEPAERAKTRDSLLRYCERDTLSLVELVRLLKTSTT